MTEEQVKEGNNMIFWQTPIYQIHPFKSKAIKDGRPRVDVRCTPLDKTPIWKPKSK